MTSQRADNLDCPLLNKYKQDRLAAGRVSVGQRSARHCDDNKEVTGKLARRHASLQKENTISLTLAASAIA